MCSKRAKTDEPETASVAEIEGVDHGRDLQPPWDAIWNMVYSFCTSPPEEGEESEEIGRKLGLTTMETYQTIFEKSLIPLGKRVRVLKQSETLSEVWREISKFEPDSISLTHARLRIEYITVCENMSDVLELIFVGGTLKDFKAANVKFWDHLRYLGGYLEALLDTQKQSTARGAKGRRKIGDLTRERVMLAAAEIRGTVSKEVAAESIAIEVKRSAATVRKILSTIYPGNEWQ